MDKLIYRFLFLLGVYAAWLGIFLITAVTLYAIQRKNYNYNKIELLKVKLVTGIVEIIKYTYSGFCEIIFTSLVCVHIGTEYVWFYDATKICVEKWQLLVILLGISYALPFPGLFAVSMKLLKSGQLSSSTFIFCCLCPALAPFAILIQKHLIKCKPMNNSENTNGLSEASKTIICVLQGPYKETGKQIVLYWEAIISTRRFLLTAMTLIPSGSIRMTTVTVLCSIFLYQHVYFLPFKFKLSKVGSI